MVNERKKTTEINTTIGDVLRGVLSKEGFSQDKIAKAIGYKTQSGIAERLRGNPRVDIVMKILDYFGYELIVRSPDGQEWRVETLNAEEDPTPGPGGSDQP